jgi:hypothetical protein
MAQSMLQMRPGSKSRLELAPHAALLFSALLTLCEGSLHGCFCAAAGSRCARRFKRCMMALHATIVACALALGTYPDEFF